MISKGTISKKMTHIGVLSLFFLIGWSLSSGPAQDSSIDNARDLLKRGEYKQAQTIFAALIEKTPADIDAQQGFLRTLIETGEYAAAEKKAKEFLAAQSQNIPARITLGEVLFETGRYEQAASELDSVVKNAKGADYLRGAVTRARALIATGKESEAQTLLQGFVGYYNSNRPQTANELTLIARGMTLLEKFKDANELFIDAREADA